jgi:hypothetical protein
METLDLVAQRLAAIEERQLRMVELLEQKVLDDAALFGRLSGTLIELCAVVRDIRIDAQIYDPQFVDAFARVSGKLNTVIEQLNARARPPASVDRMLDQAAELWQAGQARPS